MNQSQATTHLSAVEAIERLETLYEAALSALRDAISAYIRDGALPDVGDRAKGLFSYPQLSVSWDGRFRDHQRTRAYGRFSRTGQYSTTITRPTLFKEYLTEQLTLLESEYNAVFEVTPSQQEMPYPFVIDGSDLILDRSMTAGLAQHFPTTDLAKICDGITDGIDIAGADFPLSHFDALRTDFSLARLKHYTGTPAEHIQPIFYLLITAAMLMSLSVGPVSRFWIHPALIRHYLAPVAVTSPLKMQSQRRQHLIWRGKNTKCRPII